ncbi:MAG: aldo/keto reductase [Acidimicrobiales bacterium]
MVEASSGDDVTAEEPPAESGREQRVTPLELFFDLVFVFAVTQVTAFLSHNPTWGGLLRGLLLLGVLWWAWSAYAWLTNTLDPEEGVVRLVMLAAVAAMLIVSLAAPHAYGSEALIFALAYLVVRVIHLVLFAIAGRGDHDLFLAVARHAPSATLGAGLLVAAAFLRGGPQLGLWGAALAIDYLGPALAGQMRGWRISPGHFVERFGQIVIIAFGESVVAIGVGIGVGIGGLTLDGALIGAALLGITVIATLWWSYFDWVVYVAQDRLIEATGVRRAILARDAYSYLHLPMVAGIVLFAFGLKEALPQATSPLSIVPALGLVGGVVVYLLAHIALRLRIGGGLGRGRPVAAVLLAATLAGAESIPGLATLGLVAAALTGLIAYEVLRHREERAHIRSRRDTFNTEGAQRLPSAHPETRPGVAVSSIDRGRGVQPQGARLTPSAHWTNGARTHPRSAPAPNRTAPEEETTMNITLNNGVEMPALGFGVFQTPPEQTIAAVVEALRVGYRLIDTAASYFNEREVGEGIRRAGIDRSETFIETKVWLSDYGYDETLHAFDKSAGKLGVDQIDLLLLHQAVPTDFDRTIQAYRALERPVRDPSRLRRHAHRVGAQLRLLRRCHRRGRRAAVLRDPYSRLPFRLERPCLASPHTKEHWRRRPAAPARRAGRPAQTGVTNRGPWGSPRRARGQSNGAERLSDPSMGTLGAGPRGR